MRLESLDTQCAVAEKTGPDAFTFGGAWTGPTYARLGRAPRVEVEAAVDSIPTYDAVKDHVARFTERIRGRLDAIYPEYAVRIRRHGDADCSAPCGSELRSAT